MNRKNTPADISVIMPSYLGNYPGAAQNRNEKFITAVESFLKACIYVNTELIIISDGCAETIRICKTKFKKHLSSGLIRLLELPRHELFTGSVRQAGIDIAKGQILCNLDTDDVFVEHHLKNIYKTFNPELYDWAYFGYNRQIGDNVDYVLGDTNNLCTANVVWKKGLNVSWNNCNGRQDNSFFNAQLITNYPKRLQIYGCGYVVKHAVLNLIEK